MIAAEPHENPIDKACGEELMPEGLVELTALDVDPAGIPLQRSACMSDYRRVQTRFRTGPERASHHVARRAGGTHQRTIDPSAGNPLSSKTSMA